MRQSASKASSYDPNDDREPVPYMPSTDKKVSFKHEKPRNARNHGEGRRTSAPNYDPTGTTGTTESNQQEPYKNLSRNTSRLPNLTENLGPVYQQALNEEEDSPDKQSSIILASSHHEDMESTHLPTTKATHQRVLNPSASTPYKPSEERKPQTTLLGRMNQRVQKKAIPSSYNMGTVEQQPPRFPLGPQQTLVLQHYCPNCSIQKIQSKRSKTTRRMKKKASFVRKEKSVDSSTRSRKHSARRQSARRKSSRAFSGSAAALEAFGGRSTSSEHGQRFKRSMNFEAIRQRLPNIYANQYSSGDAATMKRPPIEDSHILEQSEPKIISSQYQMTAGNPTVPQQVVYQAAKINLKRFDKQTNDKSRQKKTLTLEPIQPFAQKTHRFQSQGRNMNKLKTAAGMPRTYNLNPTIEQTAKSDEGGPGMELKSFDRLGESTNPLPEPSVGTNQFSGPPGQTARVPVSHSTPQLSIATQGNESDIHKVQIKGSLRTRRPAAAGVPPLSTIPSLGFVQQLPKQHHKIPVKVSGVPPQDLEPLPPQHLPQTLPTYPTLEKVRHRSKRAGSKLRKKDSVPRKHVAPFLVHPLQTPSISQQITPMANSNWHNSKSIADILNGSEDPSKSLTLSKRPMAPPSGRSRQNQRSTSRIQSALQSERQIINTYNAEEESHRFDKLIEKSVLHFKFLPIVMQGEQLVGKVSNVKDFMDRKILYARPKHKIRRDYHTMVYYAEVSLFKSKIYFILVQQPEKHPGGYSPDKWIAAQPSVRDTISFSSNTTILEVWKKQVQGLFLQSYYKVRGERQVTKAKACAVAWVALLKRIEFKFDSLVFNKE